MIEFPTEVIGFHERTNAAIPRRLAGEHRPERSTLRVARDGLLPMGGLALAG